MTQPGLQQWALFLLSLLLYANTLFNQYALDDGLVLRDNQYVLRGISGIRDIVSHDSFYGAIGESENLTGGRYRPLPLVMYAVEVSFFGKNPFVHHLLNVLLFGWTALVLFRLLNQFLFPAPAWAFLATLLFVIHPVHTEVVANIKSRDEILSLLLLLLSLHCMLGYLKNEGSWKLLAAASAWYFLALLSKENGLIFMVFLPFSIWMFSARDFTGILKISLPFWLIALAYWILRGQVTGGFSNQVAGVMDNPYLLAQPLEKWSTIIFIWLKYLQLLLFPYPLTFDYSYNQIPYRSLADIWVWISILLHGSVLFFSLRRLFKKDILVWCALFYAGSLLLVSNIFFNIGAPMAERFLYQASVPFLVAITEIIRRIILHSGFGKKKMARSLGTGLLLPVIAVCALYIVKRNQNWKNDETLFLHDVAVSTGSARANTYAGIALIRLSDRAADPASAKQFALESIPYFDRSLSIYSQYLPTLLNKGVAYSRLDSLDAAEYTWNLARELDPENPTLKSYSTYLFQSYYRRGLQAGARSDLKSSIADLEKAVFYDPNQADAWYNLGGAYYSDHRYRDARKSWFRCLQLQPNHKQAAEGLQALEHLESNGRSEFGQF